MIWWQSTITKPVFVEMIESSKECGGSWEKVFELVKEKFLSTNEEAEEYMKLYW